MITLTTRPITRRLLLTSALLLTGFSFLATAADEKKITVGALRFTSHAPTFVALERGYFKEEGLDVELKFFQAAQPMAVGVAAKDIDYAVTALSGGLISLAEKQAVKVIGGALTEDKAIDGNQILVANRVYDAGITSAKQLDGKVWAVTQTGSSFHYMGSQIAQKEGITLKYKPLQKVGAIIGAIKSAQVDSWSVVPHIAKMLDQSKGAKIIGKVADYIPDYQVTVVFTSAHHAANDADLTRAFLRAYAKGAADYNAALVDKTAGEAEAEAMVKLIHGYVYSDRPYEKAAPSIRNGAMRINADASLNVANVKAQIEWFKSEKLVNSSVTYETVVDTNYITPSQQ